MCDSVVNLSSVTKPPEHHAGGAIPLESLLFLCTGNYYWSRFAELYFREAAAGRQLNWRADSRGLALCEANLGPISMHTITECRNLGVSTEPLRWPLEVTEADLADATMTVAVKESEHRPLMRLKFPAWENRIEYRDVHDLDCAHADEALPLLRRHVDKLLQRLEQKAPDGT